MAKKKEAKPNDCACGCGRKVKRTFALGHDAKVYAILRRVAKGEAEESAIPEAVRDDKKLLKHMLTKVH